MPGRIVFCLLAYAATAWCAHSETSRAEWEYRGFRCDISGARQAQMAAEVEASLRGQIDIVCAVGLPSPTLDFFRRVPLKVVDKLGGNPGLYTRGKTVELALAVVAYRQRPVLLHEFLHAYHDQQLKDGVRNADVRLYYERAKDKGAYAEKSHMMRTVQEFFACSATTYLAGHTGQEPFQRDKVRSSQPQYFEFLTRLFGPDAGRYEGSREGPDLQRLRSLREPAPGDSTDDMAPPAAAAPSQP